MVIRISHLVKIEANSNAYKQPDGGAVGKHGKLEGFNQEDWLDRGRPSSTHTDWSKFTDSPSPIFPDGQQTFSHLTGVWNSNKTGDIFWFPDHQRDCLGIIQNGVLVAYFQKVTTLSEAHAKLVYDQLDRQGCGVIRETEAGGSSTAWSDHRDSPLACLNIRFSPEDLIWLDNPVPLTAGASGVNFTTRIGTTVVEISQDAIDSALGGRNAIFPSLNR